MCTHVCTTDAFLTCLVMPAGMHVMFMNRLKIIYFQEIYEGRQGPQGKVLLQLLLHLRQSNFWQLLEEKA